MDFVGLGLLGVGFGLLGFGWVGGGGGGGGNWGLEPTHRGLRVHIGPFEIRA